WLLQVLFIFKKIAMQANKFLFSQYNQTNTFISIGLLLLRIYLGYSMLSAGFSKLPVPEWMVDQVTEMGLPFPILFAHLACISEFLGGVLIILGLFTRPWSILVAITMGMAAFVYHNVPIITQMHVAQDIFWMAVCIAFTGAGKYSLDSLAESSSLKVGKIPFKSIAIGIFSILFLLTLYLDFVKVRKEVPAPTIESMSLAGSFNDWSLEKNVMESMGDSTYQITTYINQGGPFEFKFAANKDWSLNMGGEEKHTVFPFNGVGEIGIQSNIKGMVPEAGEYLFTLDLKDLSYSVE
ncbi:MAG: DoxX family membrane protein, partial [Bacteroidota bacterium]